MSKFLKDSLANILQNICAYFIVSEHSSDASAKNAVFFDVLPYKQTLFVYFWPNLYLILVFRNQLNTIYGLLQQMLPKLVSQNMFYYKIYKRVPHIKQFWRHFC